MKIKNEKRLLLAEKGQLERTLNRLNEAYEHKIRELSIVRRIGDSLIGAENMKQVCLNLLEIILEEIYIENCSLMFLNDDGELRIQAVKGANEEHGKYFDKKPLNKVSFKLGKGIAGYVAEKRIPVVVNDVDKDPRFIRHPESKKIIKSLLCLPLFFQNKTIGVINLSSSRRDFFTEEDLRILTIISQQAGVVLQNIMLVYNLENMNRELMKTMSKLGESKEKYQKLFDNSADIVFIINTDGIITSINDALERLTGYKKEEVIGQNFLTSDMFSIDGKPRIPQLKFNKLLKSRERLINLPLSLPDKDGSVKHFEVNIALIRNEKGKIAGYQGSARDVTERKFLEKQLQDYTSNLEHLIKLKTEELRKSEQKYRNIAENINDIVYIYDTTGTMTYVSPSLKRVLGINPEDWLTGYREFFTKSSVNKGWEEAFREHLNGKEANPFLVEIWKSDGSKALMETNEKILRNDRGDITGVQGVFRDVTEKIRLEKEIKESEEYYRALIHSLNECVFTVKNERLLWCNAKVKEVFGYKPEEITGKHLSILVKNDSMFQKIKELYFDTLSVFGFVTFESEFKRKDGIEFAVDVSIALMEKESSKPEEKAAILVVRDITHKKELEKSLIFSERLAATGKLAASIAHEINNPLQGIQAHLDVLKEASMSFEENLDSIDQIKYGVSQINKIVTQLLDIHRPGEMAKTFINVHDVLNSVVDLLKSKLRKNKIVIKIQYSEKLPGVFASRDQLGQVFLNLILNSIESMPEGGRLRIQTKTAAKSIEIRFSDTGAGIKKSELKKIFEPFYSTKTDKQGVGLGLSVSYSIIKGHGGDIQVKSKAGAGSTFTIILPVHYGGTNG